MIYNTENYVILYSWWHILYLCFFFFLQRIFLYFYSLSFIWNTCLLFMITLYYFARFLITSKLMQKELKMTIACLLCVVENSFSKKKKRLVFKPAFENVLMDKSILGSYQKNAMRSVIIVIVSWQKMVVLFVVFGYIFLIMEPANICI